MPRRSWLPPPPASAVSSWMQPRTVAVARLLFSPSATASSHPPSRFLPRPARRSHDVARLHVDRATAVRPATRSSNLPPVLIHRLRRGGDPQLIWVAHQKDQVSPSALSVGIGVVPVVVDPLLLHGGRCRSHRHGRRPAPAAAPPPVSAGAACTSARRGRRLRRRWRSSTPGRPPRQHAGADVCVRRPCQVALGRELLPVGGWPHLQH